MPVIPLRTKLYEISKILQTPIDTKYRWDDTSQRFRETSTGLFANTETAIRSRATTRYGNRIKIAVATHEDWTFDQAREEYSNYLDNKDAWTQEELQEWQENFFSP